MNKNWVTLGILSVFAGSVSANEPASYEKWIGGFAEYYSADQEKSGFPNYYDDGVAYGAEFGFRFNPEWAARLEVSHLNVNASALGQDASGNRIGLDALYFLPDDLLYLFGGVKHFSTEGGFNALDVGMGKHWNMSEKLKLITEIVAYYDVENGYQDVGLKLGLAYTFGGSPAALMPKNNDGDNDGVNDAFDMCPNTPAGLQVDAKGCRLVLDSDSDFDGVLDSADKCANTPATDQVDATGCSVFIEKEARFELRILFANNSSKVDLNDSSEFEKLAEFMRRFPNTTATIEGHSSAPGEASYNLSLSQDRANAVRKIMINNFDINSTRLTAIGYGETHLLDESDTAAAHAKNRRVVTVVITTERKKATK